MVAILVTPEIRTHLECLSLTSKIETSNGISTIAHKPICNALRASSPPLSSLLRSTTIHLSHEAAVSALAPPPPRDPELEARINRLRARLEDEQYKAITRDVARAAGTNAEMEVARMGRIMPQMSLGVNVIVSMATCFTAGYFVMKHSGGGETAGLVGGVAGLIVAMGVEVVLVMTRMYGIERAAEKEGRRRERKVNRAVRT